MITYENIEKNRIFYYLKIFKSIYIAKKKSQELEKKKESREDKIYRAGTGTVTRTGGRRQSTA